MTRASQVRSDREIWRSRQGFPSSGTGRSCASSQPDGLHGIQTCFAERARILDVFDRVEPTEAKKRLERGAVLVDVREPDEFAQGHAQNAILIPLSQWAERYQELPTDKEVLLICAAGVRSARAADYAARFGYTCTNVEGGLHAWFAHGLPVVFPSDVSNDDAEKGNV